jgi:hypothetical protein
VGHGELDHLVAAQVEIKSIVQSLFKR